MKMNYIRQMVTTIIILQTIDCYPLQQTSRQSKNLAYLDYLQPEVDYNNLDVEANNYMTLALDDNPNSRTVSQHQRKQQQFNSPIYYIRIPPQPYVFVSGLGYVSQPVAPPVSQFLNVPLSFVSNGKPNSIYQWSGAFQDFGNPTPDPYSEYNKPKPHKSTKRPMKDSTIHKLPGSFSFNGKPDDIFVLRDSYNSLYNEVLQNVYP